MIARATASEQLVMRLSPKPVNIVDPMEEAAAFDLVANEPKAKAVDYVLSNSFGFGGVNAALVFGKAPA
jgi:3-oxoacyl-[acyl-carrier-protein] synthase II